MSRRPHHRPAPTDWHLWAEVKRSVMPLRPETAELPRATEVTGPAEEEAAADPLPAPVVRRPARAARRPRAGSGLEPALRRRLERGRIEIDGKLDLHGMRQAEAHAALGRFLLARAAQGDRTVLIITGKGDTMREEAGRVGRGVLRSMLPLWLGEPRLAPLVAGFEAAARVHGGEGAFYVRLRRPERR